MLIQCIDEDLSHGQKIATYPSSIIKTDLRLKPTTHQSAISISNNSITSNPVCKFPFPSHPFSRRVVVRKAAVRHKMNSPPSCGKSHWLVTYWLSLIDTVSAKPGMNIHSTLVNDHTAPAVPSPTYSNPPHSSPHSCVSPHS